MNKQILFKDKARLGVSEGINIVANAVKVTLGYGGRTVIISDGPHATRATKDGVTVANSITLSDEIANAGAKLIREVSSKTAQDVGDGTTTVCVLMQELVNRGMPLVQSGANPVLLKRGMELAARSIVATLDKITVPVNDNVDLLKQVACVSANNDKEIGEIVGQVFDELGKYGIVSIEDSKTPETRMEKVKGFQFSTGYYTHYFVNTSKNTCELDMPYVLIVEDKLSDIKNVMPIMNQVVKTGQPIVIIAEDFTDDIIRTMWENKAVLPPLCIKYNFSGETKDELMMDLCAMTGAKLISEKTGKKIQNIDLSYLGGCEKIICGKDETTIVKGLHSEEQLQLRIEDAKVKIENAKNPFRKELSERRLAKLSGHIAVCYVGGSTEVEVSEKKDRIDDSVKATKAAIEEGVVPGGGTALLRCINNLNSIKETDATILQGIRLVRESIEQPARQIMDNAGAVSAALTLESVKNKFDNLGYNAQSGEIEDLLTAGILDPKKVVRVCVENAVSAAAQVLISEALIVNDVTPN
jgi:chaperonin GroEL